MKINDLYNILPVALEQNMNVLLKAGPGVGKSDSVGDIIVNIMKWDMMIAHPICEEPTDKKGLPCTGIVDGQLTADFIPYGDLRRMMEATKPLVVFIDDFGQAPESVQKAYMQILLAREINGKRISKHVRFVAATNSRADRAGVGNFITPLLSRFHSIIEIEPDSDSWIDWAAKNNMPPTLISFIKQYPQKITSPLSKEIENFACPRTIANLGKWMNAGINNLEIWSGAVGPAWAFEFYTYYQTYTKIGNLPDQIINNPHSAAIPDQPDVMYLVLTALAYKANEKNLNNLFAYGARIPSEYFAFFVKVVMAKNAKLKETAAYINWAVKNPDMVK